MIWRVQTLDSKRCVLAPVKAGEAVIPAPALAEAGESGNPSPRRRRHPRVQPWMPAYAGMTVWFPPVHLRTPQPRHCRVFVFGATRSLATAPGGVENEPYNAPAPPGSKQPTAHRRRTVRRGRLWFVRSIVSLPDRANGAGRILASFIYFTTNEAQSKRVSFTSFAICGRIE
jgi:hypothetical protein